MKPMNANELLAGLALARPVPISAVVTDSRKVLPGCIFVCFPGERVDGHDYAAKAYQAGAEYVIANHPVEGVPEDHLVICESSYLAMIRMASNYRTLFSPLMIGVTGSVGKTTTIAKLAYLYKDLGKRVMLAAGDTFRAEASEQLETWADRAGVPLVKAGEGADPAAVIFDAVKSATARGYDMVIADTAGRLHNKQNLMNELNKISRILDRELPGASKEVLLVLDGTTGQNGLIQAKQFLDTADLTGIVLTKLDGTAKGGIVFAIANDLQLPVKYVGVGEQIDDLQKFDPNSYVNALFADFDMRSDVEILVDENIENIPKDDDLFDMN